MEGSEEKRELRLWRWKYGFGGKEGEWKISNENVCVYARVRIDYLIGIVL